MLKVASGLMAAGIAFSVAITPAVAQPARDAAPVVRVAQSKFVKPQFKRKLVRLVTDEAPGTIIIDTNNKYLYFVEANNRAIRYGIGVGRDGFGWSGVVKVGRKA